MSKNLIDILFQTEKDKEREKLKKEKDKLKGLKKEHSLDPHSESNGSRTITQED
jgi:hypothetical protein